MSQDIFNELASKVVVEKLAAHKEEVLHLILQDLNTFIKIRIKFPDSISNTEILPMERA